MMLRRSVLTEASLALSLVAANFGIAIAARMPMMTTTIMISTTVKPLEELLDKFFILASLYFITIG